NPVVLGRSDAQGASPGRFRPGPAARTAGGRGARVNPWLESPSGGPDRSGEGWCCSPRPVRPAAAQKAADLVNRLIKSPPGHRTGRRDASISRGIMKSPGSGRQQKRRAEQSALLGGGFLRLEQLRLARPGHGVLEVGPRGAGRPDTSLWVERQESDLGRVYPP